MSFRTVHDNWGRPQTVFDSGYSDVERSNSQLRGALRSWETRARELEGRVDDLSNAVKWKDDVIVTFAKMAKQDYAYKLAMSQTINKMWEEVARAGSPASLPFSSSADAVRQFIEDRYQTILDSNTTIRQRLLKIEREKAAQHGVRLT